MEYDAIIFGASRGIGKSIYNVSNILFENTIGISKTGDNNTIKLDVCDTGLYNNFIKNNHSKFIAYCCYNLTKETNIKDIYNLMFFPLTYIIEYYISIQIPITILTVGSLSSTCIKDIKQLPPGYFSLLDALNTYKKRISGRYPNIKFKNLICDIVQSDTTDKIFTKRITQNCLRPADLEKHIKYLITNTNTTSLTVIN